MNKPQAWKYVNEEKILKITTFTITMASMRTI
jgi:hypothetical protein